MLIDRPQVVEGSVIVNATIPSGTADPASPNLGELFFRSDLGLLRVYSGSVWSVLSTADGLATHIADTGLHLVPAQNTFLDNLNLPTLTAADVNGIPAVVSRVTTAEGTLSGHIADTALHLSSVQNTLLDGLSTSLQSSEVNQLIGVTSPIQTQLNTTANAFASHAADTSLHLAPNENTFLGTLDFGARTPAQRAADLNFLPTHYSDNTRHLTSAASTLVNGITVGFADVNRLNGIDSYLTSISAADVVGALTGLQSTKVNKSGDTITGTLTLSNSATISGIPTPVAAGDIVNKGYVDVYVQGIRWTQSVVAATTGAITLSGLQIIDTVSLNNADRVLVKDQPTAAENGIYVASNSAWSRAVDYDEASEINRSGTYVAGGSANLKSSFLQIKTITNVGTDPLLYTAFATSSAVSAGSGINIGSSGIASVDQGSGLTFSGNSLVLDLFSGGGLITTTDGVTGDTSATAQLSLAPVGTAGTYRSVTTNSKGQVTAGTNPTTIAGYGLTDALNKTGDTMTGPLVISAGAGNTLHITGASTNSSSGRFTNSSSNASFSIGTSGTSGPSAAGSFFFYDNNATATRGFIGTDGTLNWGAITTTGNVIHGGTTILIGSVNFGNGTTGDREFYFSNNTRQTRLELQASSGKFSLIDDTASVVRFASDIAGNFSVAGSITTPTAVNAASIAATSGVFSSAVTVATLAAAGNVNVGNGIAGDRSLYITNNARSTRFTLVAGDGRLAYVDDTAGVTRFTADAAGNFVGANYFEALGSDTRLMMRNGSGGATKAGTINFSTGGGLDAAGVISFQRRALTGDTFEANMITIALSTGNVTVAGSLTATSHIGSGAGLTNIPWLSLTGIPTRTTWGSNPVPISTGVTWMNFGNGHAIMDASSGSIEGTGVSNTNSASAWQATYPMLVGWNGSGTYGVRVDSARLADKASTLAAGGGNGTPMTFTFSGNTGQPNWLWGSNDGVNHSVWNPSQFSVTYAASAGNSGNTSSISNAVGGGYSWSGIQYFNSTKGGGSYIANQSAYVLEATSADGGAAAMSFHRQGAYAINMGLDPDNVFRIGGWSDGASNRMALDGAGNLTATGDVTAYSDKRLKREVQPIVGALDKVLTLNGVTYLRIDTDQVGTGLIAQDVQKVLPEAIKEDPDGMLTLAYGNLAGLFVEAIKDLNTELQSLKAELAALKAK